MSATVLISDMFSGIGHSLRVVHACENHQSDGPYGTLLTHQFSIHATLPKLELDAGPFYNHVTSLRSIIEDLKKVPLQQTAFTWTLYPDEIESQCGYLRAHVSRSRHDELQWNFEQDGPGLSRSWLMSFSIKTRLSDVPLLVADLDKLIAELGDPGFKRA